MQVCRIVVEDDSPVGIFSRFDRDVALKELFVNEGIN